MSVEEQRHYCDIARAFLAGKDRNVDEMQLRVDAGNARWRKWMKRTDVQRAMSLYDEVLAVMATGHYCVVIATPAQIQPGQWDGREAVLISMVDEAMVASISK